jgi:hypothetical protein
MPDESNVVDMPTGEEQPAAPEAVAAPKKGERPQKMKVTFEVAGQEPKTVEVDGFLFVGCSFDEQGQEWQFTPGCPPLIMPYYVAAATDFVRNELFGNTNHHKEVPAPPKPPLLKRVASLPAGLQLPRK